MPLNVEIRIEIGSLDTEERQSWLFGEERIGFTGGQGTTRSPTRIDQRAKRRNPI